MSLTNSLTERSLIINSDSYPHTNYNSITRDPDEASETLGSRSVTESEESSLTSSDVHSYKSWTRQQWMILLIQNSLILTSSVAYPLLSTFFPQEADKKGVNSFTTGLIFGVYEFVIFFMSPIFGALVVRLTPRYMCLAGSFLAGGSCLLFGFLLQCPDGTVFIVMCFMVRIVDAIGCAMSNVSSYAILSITFPHHTAIVNGIAETVAGIGFMLGPVVGAFLYDTGGFVLPFVTIGGLSLISTGLAFFEPSGVYTSTGEQESKMKVTKLLRNPGICLIYVHVFGASLALTFLDPIMSQWLEQNFTISVTMVGLVFFIWSGVYALSSPVMGKLTDKGYIFSVMIAGGVLCFLSLLFMGPSPLLQSFFPSDKQLWIVCVTCVGLGVACGAMFIPPYMAALNIASVAGHELDAKVYGVVSGLISSSASLGAFTGPTLAGYLNDSLGFEWSVTACSFIILAETLLMIIFCSTMKCQGRPLAPADDEGDNSAVEHRRQVEQVSQQFGNEEVERLLNA